MFWALVLSVTIGGHTDEYVVDSFTSVGDCYAALRTTRPAKLYNNNHATFACQKGN